MIGCFVLCFSEHLLRDGSDRMLRFDGGLASDRCMQFEASPQVSRYHQVGSEFIEKSVGVVFIKFFQGFAEFL